MGEAVVETVANLDIVQSGNERGAISLIVVIARSLSGKRREYVTNVQCSLPSSCRNLAVISPYRQCGNLGSAVFVNLLNSEPPPSNCFYSFACSAKVCHFDSKTLFSSITHLCNRSLNHIPDCRSG